MKGKMVPEHFRDGSDLSVLYFIFSQDKQRNDLSSLPNYVLQKNSLPPATRILGFRQSHLTISKRPADCLLVA